MDVLQGLGCDVGLGVLVLAAAALAVASLALWSWPRGSHNLQGKVVLLTGAGGGLGRLLALHLARRGCVLACADVAAEPNEETVALVHHQQQHKQAARAYTADLTERADIYGLVQKVLEDFGHIDILLSNAGVIQGGALWELSDAQLDLVLDVNLRATMLLAKAVLPHMRARGEGHVVAVSSSTALVPGRGIVAYAASKAGLSHAMECLHHDLRHEGLHRHIHVTTIQPFFINTFARLGSALKFGGPFRALMRFLEPDEVARLVVEAVAARKHVVCIPGHVSLVGKLLGFLPRRALAFVFERVMRLESRPPFSYEHRHKALDPCILHELLSKGYPLEEDPVDVCAGLCADLGDDLGDLGDDPQGLQGLQDGPLQYDFSPFSHQVAEFYRSRGQNIPPSVRKVFHVA